MPRLTSIPTRHSGYSGASLPPHTGGGDGRGRDSGDSMPNFGDRLRRARLGLAVAMAPIVVLFISFTAVYVAERGYVGLDVSDATYARAWVPVRLPWILLLANTAVLIISSVTIEMARREITREAAFARFQVFRWETNAASRFSR